MSAKSHPGEKTVFPNDHRFTDDVHGEIFLNSVERDCVDTPEFQRLFRVSQLGFVDLVYQTANHTRGAHSIGVCAMAQALIDRLNTNQPQITADRLSSFAGDATNPDLEKFKAAAARAPISQCETILIRLGALLHDISHAPFSHDIEQKKHVIKERIPEQPSQLRKWCETKSHYGLYPKHDDWEKNPTLFVSLLDTQRSVLARVLRANSSSFLKLLKAEAREREHLKAFYKAVERSGWTNVAEEILPQLLFHLLAIEKPDEQVDGRLLVIKSFEDLAHAKPVPWGLGPTTNDSRQADIAKKLHEAWYQPYRHDIIGDTLSADLLDYLTRDAQRMHLNRRLHLNLLNFYSLAPWQPAGKHNDEATASETHAWFRCSIDLYDYKRGTNRVELFNDIFRLLDLRHEIHEKAVFHRIVQGANAMLSRTMLLLGQEARPGLGELFGYNDHSVSLCGEDFLLRTLIDRSDDLAKTAGVSDSIASSVRSIPLKLAERRIYRPLMVIPGDRAVRMITGKADDREDREVILRKLGAIVDSSLFAPFFLFLSTCVEKLIEHYFESEQAVLNYLTEISNDDEAARKAMSVIPKGLIIWTSPYKQLYKNPGLLVSASRAGKAFQIDELLADAFAGEKAVQEIRERVKEAIADAEGKYASLWKLYAFVSDGLFYTGVQAKLTGHECSNPIDRKHPHPHKEHLHAAQRLLVTAFFSAFEWWKNFGDKAVEHANLDSTVSLNDFQLLLRNFVTTHNDKLRHNKDFEADVSSVRVEYYLHGPGTELCRDIRYKFDTGSGETWSDAVAYSDTVLAMIKQCGRKISHFKVEELNELALRYERTFGTRKWEPSMAVKDLWRGELPVPHAPAAKSLVEMAGTTDSDEETEQRSIVALPVSLLQLDEFEFRLRVYVESYVQKGEEAKVWDHIRKRIPEVNKLGMERIASVREALNALELNLSTEEGELAFASRYDADRIIQWLDEGVFNA